MSIKHLMSIVIFMGSIIAIAQQENSSPEMITDRPDQTESPVTVPLGALQIETGGFYTSFKEGVVKSEVIGYNTTLLRYGILQNFEFRLGWNFEEGRTQFNGIENPNVSSGFSPLLFGMKIKIIDESGWMPTIGFLGHLNLPFSASTDYRPETTGADFRFSFNHTLSKKSSLAYNIGGAWGDDSPELAYVYTLVYGYSVTNKIGLYAEIYGDFPEDNKANHLWDIGLTYAVMNNLQFDVTVGRSITKGQDLLLAAGVSYRLFK